MRAVRTKKGLIVYDATGKELVDFANKLKEEEMNVKVVTKKYRAQKQQR